MKMIKKFINTMMVLLLALIIVTPAQSFAIDRIDLDKDVTLTVNYLQDETPVPGANFHLFRVADTSETADFTLTGDFAKYPVKVKDLDSQGWTDLATTLYGYVRRDGIKPMDNATTNAAGQVKFPTTGTMKPGLYLVTGDTVRFNKMIMDVAPALICLPDRPEDSESWTYDAVSFAKYMNEGYYIDNPISHKVSKVWQDEGFEEQRPDDIEVQLLQDNEVFDTVTLSAENNWSYEWPELDGDYTYTVVETEVTGYTVSVSQNEEAFVITNTNNDWQEFQESEEEETLPQTGVLWWPVFALIAAALIFFIIGVARNRGTKGAK